MMTLTCPKFMNNFELGATIGRGSFSIVRKAIEKTTGETVAIKIVTPEEPHSVPESQDFDNLLIYDRKRIAKETELWKPLQHPNVCRLLQIIEEGNNVAFVMEYAGGGDYLQYLMNDEARELDLNTLRTHFHQLVSAVHYLHSNGLIHGDIKLENILLNENGILLSDFGLARPVSDLGTGNFGTIEYAAPEVISATESNPVDGFKADIWALGVVLYTFLYRQFPFDAPNSKILKARILNAEVTIPNFCCQCNHPLYADAKDLLLQILVRNSSLRPGIDSILAHPFLDFPK